MPNIFTPKRNVYLYRHRLFSIIIFYILASTLVTSSAFIYSSLTPFFLYLTGLSLLILFSGYTLITADKKITFRLSMPIIAIMLWAAYVVFNGCFLHHNFNLFNTYLLSGCGLYLALVFLFNIYQSPVKALFTIITLLALIECLICFGQYIKMLPSLNTFFPVTGSWENPNVTAMFLAMAVPAAYVALAFYNGLLKRATVAVIMLMVLTILLLQCRTAIIGLIVELLIVSIYKFRLSGTFKTKANRPLFILVTILSLAVIIPVAKLAYKAKEASADGRKLIWKLSGQMIMNEPFAGYGYGTFEKYYNLKQAAYFKEGAGSEQEQKNAAFVHMGYNELLQNGVEGGVLGSLLLIFIFYSLLKVPVFKKHSTNRENLQLLSEQESYQYIIIYIGVAAFVVMSVFNFTLQAIPVLCLFIFYGAILTSHPYLKRYDIPGHPFFQDFVNLEGLKLYTRRSIAILAVVFGLLMTFQISKLVYYNYLNNQARLEKGYGNYATALTLMGHIEDHLNGDESYWTNYGNILFSVKNYAAALIKYKQAITLISDPAIYSKLAQCYLKTGDYAHAENAFLTAAYIEPGRVAPRFALLNLYLKMNDTIKTVNEAKLIVDLTPKVPSQRVSNYKYHAMLIMNKLNHPYHQ